MVVDQGLAEGLVPERLWGSVAPRVRALALFRASDELRESDDSSTCGLFASAEYEFGLSGDFVCRAGGVRVDGRWWRSAGPVVEFEATGREGETLDGFVIDEGDGWRLDALFTATTYRHGVVSVLRDVLGVAAAEGSCGQHPGDSNGLDPGVAAQLASVDEFLGGLSRRIGLVDGAADRWRSVFPLDVLVPQFDVTITPSEGFPSAAGHPGTLLLTPSGDGERVAVTLRCQGSIDVGWLSWSVETSLSAFTAGGGLTVVDDRPGSEGLVWYAGRARSRLRLMSSRLELHFDPATSGVVGQVTAIDTDGGHRVAQLRGTVRGRVTEKLRRILTPVDLAGHWSAVAGPLCDLTVPVPERGSGPVRVTPEWADGPAFVRLAAGPDLAVGLMLTGERAVPLVLRREEPASALVTEADDRLSLRHLAGDLALAGRHAAAAPLLRRAAELTWARQDAADFTTGDLIGLISLIDHQLIGAFELRDYPSLLEHLAQAVQLRHRLAAEPHTLSSFLRACRERATEMDATAGFLAELGSMVEPHLDRASAPVAGLSRLRAVLGEGKQAFLEGVVVVQAAIDDVTEAGMRPTTQTRIRLQGTVEGLQRELRRCAGLLREGAERLLEPNEAALAAAAGPVSERRTLLTSCLPFYGGSSADDRREVPNREVAELDAREEAMLERIAADPHLTPGLRDLFRMEFVTATKLLGEAAELEAHAGDLDRWEIAERVHEDRRGTTPVVAEFAEHLERWRALLEEDQEKIAAVDEAVPIFAGLVGLLADLDADWDALVASEKGRARAFADLLRERTEPADQRRATGTVAHLDRGVLERVLREHDRPVVEYFLGDEELVIWLVPRGARELVVRRQKISRHQVVEQVDELRCLLDEGSSPVSCPGTTGGPGVDERLRALGDLLWNCLPPEALPSNPDEAVYVVPHDVLFRVPFSALRDTGGSYLVDRHALVVLPSVAMLPLLRERRERAQALRSMAATLEDGNGGRAGPRCLAMVSPTPMPLPDPAEFPEISGPLSELDLTAECFPGIADLFGKDEIAVRQGAEATWDAFRAGAPDAEVLVFATHAHAVTGVGDAGRDPFDSFIALAPTSTHNGLLRARDVGANDLALRADLAILSACSTGSGKITGDGVLGLGRAFLTAGSTALLMTLEETPEEIALEVVHRFLKRWLVTGGGAAASLRRALSELRSKKRYEDPALWSLFVLFGLDLARGAPDSPNPSEEQS